MDYHNVHQMDVNNAFLNGALEAEIYPRAPPAVAVPPGCCLCLKKLIYGLKQAPPVWYRDLSAFFALIGFNPSPVDPCLFISGVPDWKCYVHVYINDMVIISKDVKRFKDLILAKYSMEDLGQALSLLSMKLNHSDGKITLSQQSYAEEPNI